MPTARRKWRIVGLQGLVLAVAALSWLARQEPTLVRVVLLTAAPAGLSAMVLLFLRGLAATPRAPAGRARGR